MTREQEQLLERGREALIQLNHKVCEDAAAVIHDLMREVRTLQDRIDQLEAPEVA